MTRIELITGKEFWSSLVHLRLWKLHSESDSDKWEDVGKQVVDEYFMSIINELKSENEELKAELETYRSLLDDGVKEVLELKAKVRELADYYIHEKELSDNELQDLIDSTIKITNH